MAEKAVNKGKMVKRTRRATNHKVGSGWCRKWVLAKINQYQTDVSCPVWLSSDVISRLCCKDGNVVSDHQVQTALTALHKAGDITKTEYLDGSLTWVPTGVRQMQLKQWSIVEYWGLEREWTSWRDAFDGPTIVRVMQIISAPEHPLASVPESDRLSVFCHWFLASTTISKDEAKDPSALIYHCAHHLADFESEWYLSASDLEWAKARIADQRAADANTRREMERTAAAREWQAQRDAANKRAYQDSKGGDRWAYDRQPSQEQRTAAYQRQQERALQYLVDSEKEEREERDARSLPSVTCRV